MHNKKKKKKNREKINTLTKNINKLSKIYKICSNNDDECVCEHISFII